MYVFFWLIQWAYSEINWKNVATVLINWKFQIVPFRPFDFYDTGTTVSAGGGETFLNKKCIKSVAQTLVLV